MYFYNSPLQITHPADYCDEPLIVKASEMLKKNPDLWFEWVEIWNERRREEGGLEKWIFSYNDKPNLFKFKK